MATIAIDLGAESCRVSLLRWVGDEPFIELVHRFPNAPIQIASGLCWDIGSILDGLDHGLRKAAKLASEGVASIAVDGWAVDYVRLNQSSEAVADPFCYRDPRTSEGERVLHARISPDRMRQITGVQILPLNTAYQLAVDDAEIREMPWINLPEYVLHRLGGRVVSEITNASHTQMMTLEGEWSAEICQATGTARSNCPEIVQPGTDLGQISGPLADLPSFAKTRLVAPACHDTASAIAAVPDDGDDWAYISSGTWSLVGTVLLAPLNSTAACAENFANLRGAGNTVCFHKNVNGMWILHQCIEAWKRQGVHFEYGELVRAAGDISAPNFLLDIDEPELLLAGDMPGRIDAQLHRRGLECLDTSPHGAPVVASLLFHSLAARYADVLRTLATITGKRFRRIFVMGGGSQNKLLNSLTARSTGLEVVIAGTECSTLGNFAVQLAAQQLGRSPDRKSIASWAEKLANRQPFEQRHNSRAHRPGLHPL